MRALQQYINEGLLDDDFDISIESLNIDGIHNKSLFRGFKWVLEQPNEVLMYYLYLKPIVDAFDEFNAHLDKNHYQKTLQFTINQLEKPIETLRDSWTSQKVLNDAISEINQYSKPVKVLLELDKQMHKTCGASWDTLKFAEYEEDVEFRVRMIDVDKKVQDKIQQIVPRIKNISVDFTDTVMIIRIV